MDFEGIGMAMGMRKSIADIEAIANSRISEANRTIAGLIAKVEEARGQVARLQSDLNAEKAHSAGLAEVMKSLRAEMADISPHHRLFQPTGRLLQDSKKPQTNLSVVYEKAFDKEFDLKFGNPKDFREIAI